MSAEKDLADLKERVRRELLEHAGSGHLNRVGACGLCELFDDCAPPDPVDPWIMLKQLYNMVKDESVLRQGLATSVLDVIGNALKDQESVKR